MSRLDHQRAVHKVKARRGDLGMSQQGLAETAGVDIKTVNNFEARGRWPIAQNRAKIEAALGWASGSLQQIAEGGEPVLLEQELPPDVNEMFDLSPELRAAFLKLSPRRRARILALYAEEQAGIEEMRRQSEARFAAMLQEFVEEDEASPSTNG